MKLTYYNLVLLKKNLGKREIRENSHQYHDEADPQILTEESKINPNKTDGKKS